MNGIFYEGRIEDNYIGHIMAEVYKERVYAPLLDGKSDLTILDIGANIGITANYFSQFANTVYAVEPSKEHFGCIQKMIEFNGNNIIRPINKAIYVKSGIFPLFQPPNKTMRSLHMAVAQEGTPSELVECITLDQLFKENGIDHVHFMKLDVEGSEAEILGDKSFRGVAPMIDSMLVEVHNWNGRHPHQIDESLKNAGFKVRHVPNDANIVIAEK
jgi:FkbM family methyltransferase